MIQEYKDTIRQTAQMLLDTPEGQKWKYMLQAIIDDVKKMDYLLLTHELVDQLMDGIIMSIQGFDKHTEGQYSTAAKTIENAATID